MDTSDTEPAAVPWQRLSTRGQPPPPPVWHEGVPDHLRSSLKGWVREAVTMVAGPYSSSRDVVQRVERTLRVGPYHGATGLLWMACESDDELALDVLDLLVAWLTAELGGDMAKVWHLEELGSHLAEGGSVWALGQWAGHAGLIRRIDETTKDLATAAFELPTPASDHLRKAWVHCFGPRPDPGQALDEAIKAIEAAAKPIVTPQDRVTTLGKMIAALKAKPSKWVVPLGTVDQLVVRLAAMWTIQPRHGTDDPNAVRDVEPAAAEAAVTDAVTLVHWFGTGLVQLADTDTGQV